MSVSTGLDPEVLADLRLREATERDATRSREMPKYVAPRIVERVPCRARCGQLADWTDEAEQAFETFNRALAAKADAPLDKTKIAFCSACVDEGRKLIADNSRKHVDKLAEKVRELKDSERPWDEGELLSQLRKLGHPDIPGLVSALRDRRDKQPAGRRVRSADVLR